MVWGVLAGCLWAVANTLTIFKIRDVGLSIAFPLWNMNSLIGILWGVTLFNELRNTGARRWLSVLGGALLMFAGACLLACASSAQTTPEHAMRGIVAALAAGVLWGTMYIPYRKAYLTGMNPLSFVAFFTIGELVTMTILALTSRGGAIPLYFRCVITHADHRISSQIGRMLQHQFKGVFASLLAQIGQQGYVTADNRLQSGANGADDGSRAHDDSAHQSQIAHNCIAVERESGGYHGVRNGRARAHPGIDRVAAHRLVLAANSRRITRALAIIFEGDSSRLDRLEQWSSRIRQARLTWP